MEGDAGKERILIRSPVGESKIEMGAPNSPEGIRIQTQLDKLEETVGKLTTKVEGNVVHQYLSDFNRDILGNVKVYTAGIVDTKIDSPAFTFHGGLLSDTFIGGKHSGFVGMSVDTYWAYKYTVCKSRERKRFHGTQITSGHAVKKGKYYADVQETNLATHGITTSGKVRVDSDTEYLIVGGDGDASQIKLASDGISIKTGSSTIAIKKSGSIIIESNGDLSLFSHGKMFLGAEGGLEVAQGAEAHIKMGKIIHKFITVG
jgi:hypothetical protein